MEAVWQCAFHQWDNWRLESYLAENERLFESRDGRRQLVTDAVDLYYRNLHAEDQPLWINRLLMRSILNAQGVERMREMIGEHLVGAFCALFRRLTDNDDRLSALCWTMNIISPGSYLTASATDFLTFAPVEQIDYALLRRLQAAVTRNALFAVGLND